jgi:hypothetical protein
MFSLFALLSMDKVNIFNDSLVDLARFLINDSEWNTSDKFAKRAAAVID